MFSGQLQQQKESNMTLKSKETHNTFSKMRKKRFLSQNAAGLWMRPRRRPGRHRWLMCWTDWTHFMTLMQTDPFKFQSVCAAEHWGGVGRVRGSSHPSSYSTPLVHHCLCFITNPACGHLFHGGGCIMQTTV